MRKIVLLLATTFLLQSCFSYKQMETNPSKMVIGKKYKIEQNHKFSRVVLKSISDSSIIVSKNWKEQQIPLKEITSIRKRKFSIIKTISLVPITVVSIVLIYVIANPNIGAGFGGFQFPN